MDDADGRAGWVGRTLGDTYRLESLLGAGGMGAVFAATDLRDGREVAVKVLTAEPSAPRVARFVREAKLAARLEHPHVVRVFEVAVDAPSGRPFLVQERLRGRTLRALLDARGPLPGAELVSLALPVVDALAFAHARGVVHRDVKPDNLFLAEAPGRPTPWPVLIDFGVAASSDPALGESLTATGALLGTARYLSPEQCRGEPAIDGRADLWAMGVTLFEALTGERPYDGANPQQVTAAILTRDPPRLSGRAGVDPRLAAAIDAALVRDRDRRTPTMAALAAQLRGDEVPPASTVPSRTRAAEVTADDAPPSPTVPPRRRAPALLGAALVAVAAAWGARSLRVPAARESSPPPPRPARFDAAAPPTTPRAPDPLTDAGLVTDASPLAPDVRSVGNRRRSAPPGQRPGSRSEAPRDAGVSVGANGAVILPVP